MNRLLSQLTNPVLPPGLGGGTTAPSPDAGGTAVGNILSSIMGAMFLFGFIIAMIYLITGAFHWITSGGDKTNLENARGKIIHAIVGLIVLASVWAVMVLVADFFGLDFEKLPIPTIGG